MQTCAYCLMRGVNLARTHEEWERLCNYHWLLYRVGDFRITFTTVQV